MTDAIASWITQGFVAGLYDSPPFPDFRVNMLMAKQEKANVRPILNLSTPKGASFNEAVNLYALQKLTMPSPVFFSQPLLETGPGAIFCKKDMENAYKLVPVHPADWKCYGFQWLGENFF
jgi:hypothetical protein